MTSRPSRQTNNQRHTYSAEEARQGKIVLDTPGKRLLFIASLGVALAVMITVFLVI